METPVTVTVLGRSQFEREKIRLDGETIPSVVSSDLIGITTSILAFP